MKGLNTLIYQQLNSLLPEHCLLCLASIDPHNSLSLGDAPSICRHCYRELPTLGNQCRRCALPLYDHGDSHINATLCGECLNSAATFDKTYCAFIYDAPIDQLINRIKHQADFSTLPMLNKALIDSVSLEAIEHLDVLIPVPLHWRRQLMRGFNQATLITKALSKAFKIPYNDNLTKRHQATTAQQQFSRKQRLGNLKQAFQCSKEVRALHIGLVDDVITTGATVTAVSNSLLATGASSVTLFALARTAKTKFNPSSP